MTEVTATAGDTELPPGARLLCPTMAKPGIRLAQPNLSYHAEVSTGSAVVSVRDLIRRYGFVTFTRYAAAQSEARIESVALAQGLHHDRNRTAAVSLRYRGRDGGRGCSTVVACANPRTMTETLRALKPHGAIIDLLRMTIQAGLQRVLPDDVLQWMDEAPEPEVAAPAWMALLFDVLRKGCCEAEAHPINVAVHAHLETEGLAYRHEFNDGDCLIVSDDSNVFHARGASRSGMPVGNSSLFREYFYE